VFAVDEVSTALLQQALRAGARDTVPVYDGDALRQSVDRVGALLAGSTTRVPAVPAARPAPGRLIVVFSTKGGVGKSTIAVNIAVAMARRSGERIALVDGDLQFGDVAVLLGIPPQHTVIDAAASADVGDSDLLFTMLSRHESGLLVLPAPTDPTMGAPLRADEMLSVCRALRATCAHVVVDLPAQFDEVTLALLEAADDVLLVGGMDIPSVKNLKIGMQALDLAAIAGPKLRLVLNRANTQVKLDVREVEQVLGLRAEFPIPSDIAVPLSVNAGIPVVDNSPKSAATRALEHIASSLLGTSDASYGKGWGKKRRRRGRK
jgi:pilus assembly protein CpaE